MGFSRVKINKGRILNCQEEIIDRLFSSDILIFEDEWSKQFFQSWQDKQKTNDD